MKLQNENAVEPAKCHGVEQVTDFSINVSAQAFSILSAGLYKDPIRAIIRELSTNAVDSHTEAGTSKKPFDVEFPTKFAPLFRIRDYGTGLSKKDVLGLYSTYFSSTKTESNEQIGALGLGSKSPLGYTNSFSVVSYFEGTKYNFSVFIGDNGFPNIAVTGESRCGTPMMNVEPSGLEIIIPVKEESYQMYKWYDNAKDVYKYFDVIPNITGDDVKVERSEYSRIIDNVKVHKDNDRNRVIMGNIAYPLDLDAIDIDRESLTIIGDVTFDIYVNIGDVAFLPNREELSYNDGTKKIIRDSIKSFVKDLRKDVKKSISEIRNINRAFKTFDDITNNYSLLIRNSQELREMLLKKIDKWDEFIEATIATGYGHNGISYKIKNIMKILDEKFDRSLYYNSGKKTKMKHSTVAASPRVLTFWINDTNKPIISKFGRAVDDNNHNILIPVIENSDDTVKYIRRKFKVTNKQIKFVSDLTFPKIERVKKKGIHINRMRKVSYGYSYNRPQNWKWERGLKLDNVEDFVTKFVWVEVKGYDSINHIKKDGYSLPDFLGVNRNPVWGLKSVYGIKSCDVEEIKSRANWVHIDDYVKETINNYIKKNLSNDITYTISGLETMIQFARKMDIEKINNIEIKSIIELLKNINVDGDGITRKIYLWKKSLGIDELDEIGIDFDSSMMYNDGEELKKFIEENYKHLVVINDIGYYNVSDEVYNLINDLY